MHGFFGVNDRGVEDRQRLTANRREPLARQLHPRSAMTELVHERPLDITDGAGGSYDRIRVYAEPHPTGMWAGVIEFVAADGTRTVRTSRETTQSTVADVAYWATGLEPLYFEGALDRALRHEGTAVRDSVRSTGWRSARVEVASAAPDLPLRLMETRTLAPGWRRRVHEDGVLIYEGTLVPAADGGAGRYAFVVQFRSENGAALVANAMWSATHGRTDEVFVEGAPVTMNHSLIKDALLRSAINVDDAA